MLSTLNLSIDVYSNDDCTSLMLEDTTGLYSVNNLNGYGLPNGATINNVTSFTITLNYTMLSIACVYTFTVVNGVITAATINFNAIGAVNILTQLTSTSFPFKSTNPFTFFNTYLNGSNTVTLPTIEDGAYSVSYAITGRATDIATPTDFSNTTTDMFLMDCATCCCIGEMFAEIPDNCSADSSKITKAITAKSYLEIARYAADDANSTRANLFINKAKEICDCDCGC